MKKNSASQTAFFNPRVVIGFTLCSVGVLLALAATGGDGKTASGFSAVYKNIGVDGGTTANTAPTTWQFVSSMSVRRTHVAVASGLDGVYALGGDTDRYVCSWGCGVTASVERYSFATGLWSTIAPMNKARDYFAAAAGSDGRIYAIGGWTPDEDVTNTAEVYSPDTNSWAFITAMPVRVAMEAATTGQDGRIYVLGGGPAMNQATRTMLIYDPATNTWSHGPSMLEPLTQLGAATGSDGRIYAIAANPEVYDPGSGVWSFIAPLPTARSYLAGAADRAGRIYALGGCCAPGALQEVDIYSPAINTWTLGPSMLLQRSTPGVAFGGDGRLYAVGGSDDTFNLRSAEVLETTSSGCLAPPAGLISWWSGDRTTDDVQGINPGQLVGGASYKPGMVGPGFLLDGIDDSVVIPDSPSLNPRDALTLDAWVFWTGQQGNILAKDGESFDREYKIGAGGQVGGPFFRAHIGVPSGYYFVDGATVLTTGTWYHIAETYDGAFLKLYVNGGLDASIPVTGRIITTSQSLYIGDFVAPLRGRVDEAQIFNRALTDAEILAIYQAGAAGQCKPDIFVASVDPSYTVSGHGFRISTSIVIQDVNSVGINDATVQLGVILPSGSALTLSLKTDATGHANVSSTVADSGLYRFKVRTVTHPNRIYDPSLNIESGDTLLIP